MLERLNVISALIGGVVGASVTCVSAVLYVNALIDKVNKHEAQLTTIYNAVNGVSPPNYERGGVWNAMGGVKCDAGSIMIGGAVNTKLEGFARCVRIVQ